MNSFSLAGASLHPPIVRDDKTRCGGCQDGQGDGPAPPAHVFEKVALMAAEEGEHYE